MSDTQMRQLEREIMQGNVNALYRLHQILLRRHAKEPESPLDVSDLDSRLPLNICCGDGWINACDCFMDACSICNGENRIDCDGCLRCVAPSIYWGIIGDFVIRERDPRYIAFQPSCCLNRGVQLRRIERLKRVREGLLQR